MAASAISGAAVAPAGAPVPGAPLPVAVPVVLLHGFAQDAASWDEVAQLLRARGHRVEAVDFNAETKACPDGTPLMGHLCAAVTTRVRRVAREEGAPPVLAGYSMGGRIALEALARAAAPQPAPTPPAPQPAPTPAPALPAQPAAPLPLAALVLEGAGLGPRNSQARQAFAQRNAEWAARLRTQGVERFMDFWETLPLFASQRDLPPAVQRRVRAGRLRCEAGVLERLLVEAGQHEQASEAATLGALSALAAQGIPLIYVVGRRDEKYGALAERVRAAVPSVRLCSVSDAGHNVHLEQPARFAEALAHVACRN